MKRENSATRIQHEKGVTWQKCNVKNYDIEKLQHRKSATWKKCNMEKVQHGKSTT